jgi:tRNA1Val (adenine37-N6)-methyltransferase
MGFRFKQFTIEHDACAMKVGTDSIMLGSWVPPNRAQRILDVGTGSGLLSIMLAQKSLGTCLIYGIDIDAAAISQAKDNAKHCPWSKRLAFQQTAIQQFSNIEAFDLIISNPPYFSINHKANKTLLAKNRLHARQTVELDHPTLLREVTKRLTLNGQFYCVLPADIATEFILDAEKLGLYCVKELQVRSKPQADVTRLLLEFSHSCKSKISEKLSIHDHLGAYSKEYIALCQDYYLNF